MGHSFISHGTNDDASVTPQPSAEPIEELVLELTDLKLEQIQDGDRCATARARLVYDPATPGMRAVATAQSWRFVAPLGPLEADDLRWYLEKYAIWPGDVFRLRARKVEQSLVAWGRRLHDAAMPPDPAADVLRAWAKIDDRAGRRFSVHVDPTCEGGAPEADVATAREAAARLLGLPWELMHDGSSFLFQGARPTRVRRRLPSTRDRDVCVVATPIRILLICARPEDDACGYIDHRSSALPLVDAMEHLLGQVELRILAPPTLPALREELDRALREHQPYHVVHFDGHGVYDRRAGRGGLCFEHPDDTAKLQGRRHQMIFADELGGLLHDHRIPLVFLEACQTAKAERASESVASELLRRGVASVVAMSHSVLVETARRFVTAFYAGLARGGRVGDAMLEGQRYLKADTLRGRIFGDDELHLEDWFVPVLFQEREDPQLFQNAPAMQSPGALQAGLMDRLGALPPPPSTGFVGRSRELLALERLLCDERYAVVRGGGGEGKTGLAAEFARWMVRSQRFRRAAFVSTEAHGTAHAVLDALGRQLVPDYSVATFANIEVAEQPVARALDEQSTLLVVDNLESILPPPYLAADTPELLAEEYRSELAAILMMCERLQRHGETRIVFTSREALPAPFDGEANRRELQRLHRDDAVKLVERTVHQHGVKTSMADAQRAAIEDLVEAVHGHARTLTLLAPVFQRFGVDATRKALVELMADMDRRFPGNRERSLFASVELSLRRLSPDARQRARVLGVFHGGLSVGMLEAMMEWEEVRVAALMRELIDCGLASPKRFPHLSVDPALCPYLHHLLDEAERDDLTARWATAMRSYASLLYDRRYQDPELVATLTLLELPNLLALLAEVARRGDAGATVNLATILMDLLGNLGRPQLLARLGDVRHTAAARSSATWSHVRFLAEEGRIDKELASGRLREALVAAQALLHKARTAGEHAYADADYDLAMACFTFGHTLERAGNAQEALPYLDEAQRRFEAAEEARRGRGGTRMASLCLSTRGNCLVGLGRFGEAAAAYEECISRYERDSAERDIAVVKGQLGILRREQRRFQDALDLHAEARERFRKLGEPGSVARAWFQIGNTHREAGQLDAAEDAYRQSLAITVQLGDVRMQAETVTALGALCDHLGRLEEAAALYRTAVDQAFTFGDALTEGSRRTNLAYTLGRLGRWSDAREQIHRAIECEAPFGNAASPWTTWHVLAEIEAGAGNVDRAAQARARACACFLAYRRDGGENHFTDGRVGAALVPKLVAGDAASASAELEQLLTHPEVLSHRYMRPFVVALRAIADGSRDRSLADNPELHFTSAAELLLVLDALEARGL